MDTFDKFDDGVILYKIVQLVTRPLTASRNGSMIENLSSNRSVGGVIHGSVNESNKFTSLNGKKKKPRFGKTNKSNKCSKKGSHTGTS